MYPFSGPPALNGLIYLKKCRSSFFPQDLSEAHLGHYETSAIELISKNG